MTAPPDAASRAGGLSDSKRQFADTRLEVAAGVIEQNGRVLIAQRKSGGWEFPGGKLEPGETPAQALARELLEELGVGVKVGDRLMVVEHDYPDRSIRLHTYWGRIESGSPRAIDCRDFRWVTVEELAEVDLLAADRKIAARLVETLPSAQESQG